MQVLVRSFILAFLLAEVFCFPVQQDVYSRYSAPERNQFNQQVYFDQAAKPLASSPGQQVQSGPKGVVLKNPPQARQQVSEWAVAPAGLDVQTEEPVAPQSASLPLPPPEAQYQAGDLYRYKTLSEKGELDYETEEQGFLPPPPEAPEAPKEVIQAPPPKKSDHGGVWGPYTHYTNMFLSGKFPVGTLSYFRASHEQGSDNWRDDHYLRRFPSEPSLSKKV